MCIYLGLFSAVDEHRFGTQAHIYNSEMVYVGENTLILTLLVGFSVHMF